MPGALAEVAVVVTLRLPLSTALVSPLTKPTKVAENGGMAPPVTIEPSSPNTDKMAGFTVTVPLA